MAVDEHELELRLQAWCDEHRPVMRPLTDGEVSEAVMNGLIRNRFSACIIFTEEERS